MSVYNERKEAIETAVKSIEAVLDPDLKHLVEAERLLGELSQRADLFPVADFALPAGDETDRTYLVHEHENGTYALYVCTSVTGIEYRPHDHGGSWAVIAAITGAEQHRFYSAASGDAPVKTGEKVCQPGHPVSMPPTGIHSIHAVGDIPLMHLHLYGTAFHQQSERREFDPVTGEERRFELDDFGFVEDRR